MSSKYHNLSKSGFHRSQSTPSRTPDSFWFRDQSSKTWSPKSDDSDHSFGSDEENIAMETDSHMDSNNWNYGKISQRPKFVLKTPLLSSVMVSTAQQKPSYPDSKYSLSGGSSKSLVVGRPVRAVGLKDIDLTKNARAEEIRRAKAANRRTDDRHMLNPVSQYSTPPIPYLKANNTMTSSFHGNVYGISNISVDDDYHVIPNTPPPEYSTLVLPFDADKSSLDKSLPKVISESNISKLILYSEFIDDTKFDEGLENMENKDVIEISDDDSLMATCFDSNESYSSTFDDQKACRQRHIETQPKSCSKRSSSPYFSDDEENDDDDKVEALNQAKTKCASTEIEKPLQVSKPTRTTIFHVLGLFLVFVIASYLYLHFNPHGLCLESEFQVNLTGLEEDFKREFYGQHLAMKVLLSSLKSHVQGKRNKPLVLSLHGWTGTGKNYVSGIIAKHFLKHGHRSRFIYKFIVPLHFPHISDVNLYRKQLRQWIIGNVTKCNKGGLFIFDEMDKIPDGIVSILKPFLDSKGLQSALDLNKFVFLFLSNSGGQRINQYVLEHYKQGHARETINLVGLEGLLHRYAETHPITWYNELLKSEVIDYFVPFLPLERAHVRQCVRRDMRTKGYIILDTMVTEVTNEMSYFPQDLQLFSISGCKKVSSKVDVTMG